MNRDKTGAYFLRGFSARVKAVFVTTALFVATLLPDAAQAHQGPHESLKHVDALLEKHPDDLNLLYRRSHCLRELGRDDEALDLLNRLVREDSASGEFRVARASLLRDRGAYEQALPDLDAALVQGYRVEEVLLIRAEVYRADNQLNKALKDYKAAAEHVQNEEFYAAYASCLEEQGQFGQVAPVLQTGLKKYPNSVLLQQAFGKYLIRQKEYPKALTVLDSFIHKAAFKTELLLLKAECQRAMKLANEAERTLEQALAECNKFIKRRERPIHRYYRAQVYLMMHELDAAMADVMFVLHRAPGFKDAVTLKQQIETAKKGCEN